ETIVKLNQQQNVYNASLSVGAKIIQTSLVDFLR
ncbi:MAG: flagellar hook-associated protein FlgL, partial [Sporolactobacillus laevolacticus]|nr:flagellar hook-associated protein FlgL [Sporolactobacillus laevolacticus]